ncbi:MAG: hypothetical protein ACI4XB_02200, partial [Ruminococcus sp.]
LLKRKKEAKKEKSLASLDDVSVNEYSPEGDTGGLSAAAEKKKGSEKRKDGSLRSEMPPLKGEGDHCAAMVEGLSRERILYYGTLGRKIFQRN